MSYLGFESTIKLITMSLPFPDYMVMMMERAIHHKGLKPKKIPAHVTSFIRKWSTADAATVRADVCDND